MKKIIVLFFLLIGIGVMGKAQNATAVSVFTVTSEDTLVFTSSDNIESLNIAVPSGSTDSTEIFGLARTIESGDVSQVVSGIELAPGESYFIYGNGKPIRYLYIIIRGTARISLGYSTKR